MKDIITSLIYWIFEKSLTIVILCVIIGIAIIYKDKTIHDIMDIK